MGLTVNAPIAAFAPTNLLSHPAGSAAKLLRYQSSFLRLCAAGAPKPWFQFQSSFLRLWAESCEIAARNLENGFAPRTGIEQQQRDTKFPEACAQAEQRADNGAKQDNNIIDQLNFAATEAAGKWAAATSAAATADKPRTTEMNRKKSQHRTQSGNCAKEGSQENFKAAPRENSPACYEGSRKLQGF